MKRKIGALALCALLFALSLSAQAQQPGKIPRIGFISGRGIPTSATPDPNARAFQQGLRDHGYTEGKNIVLELRYAEGKPDRAADREVLNAIRHARIAARLRDALHVHQLGRERQHPRRLALTRPGARRECAETRARAE